MSFVEHLRSEHRDVTPGPSSRRYSLAGWNDAYRLHHDGSLRDSNAHAAGAFYFDRLERLRRDIAELETHMTERKPEDVADRIASIASLVWVRLLREEQDTPPHEGFTALEHLAMRRFTGDAHHAGYTTAERIEGSVDAVRYPLRATLRAKRFGSQKPALPEMGLREGISEMLRLAQLYSMYERSWEQVLWFDAKLAVRANGQYTLSDQYSTLARESAHDLARREMSYQREAYRFWMNGGGGHDVDALYPLVHATGELSVVPLRAMPDVVRQRVADLRVHRLILTGGELVRVLEKGFFPGIDITVDDAMEVHLLLAVIATQLVGMAMPVDGTKNEAALDLRFDVEALVGAIAPCVPISADSVRAVIRALTFDPTKETEDLWEKPLIPTYRGLALVAPSLVTGDIKRLVASWSKQSADLKRKHSERGHAFAAHVHHVLSILAPRTRLPSPVIVVGPNLDIPGSDIDCLMVYGDTSFVLECRICPHAATPYEHWTVDRYIEEKVSQVKGQVAYLEGHPEAIVRLSGVASPVSRVVGVVVTNSYLHEGTSRDGVYFAHIDTLAHLVAYGGLLFGAPEPADPERTLRAKATDGPSADALIDAIARGDKALFYRQHMGLVRNLMPSTPRGGMPGQMHSWIVGLPPVERMWEALHGMPFAKHLEVVDGATYARMV
jgi:hypothetical protein